MKKIGIVSCYFQPNYGSMLQALATQMALDRLGYPNETIDISGLRRQIWKDKIRYFTKAALTTDILLSKSGRVRSTIERKLPFSGYGARIRVREENFGRFCREHFRLSRPCPTMEALAQDVRDRYASILVGSDQLWLPANIAAGYYTLSWVPEGINTAAYATSFGQSSLPKDSAEKAAAFLRKIRHLSVREESGQDLVGTLTGRSVPVLCDPTLLFDGSEWLSIQQDEPLIKEPYIFTYFLGNNPMHREFVKKLKSAAGCRVAALLHLDEHIRSDEKIADFTPYDVDPAGFLNLIRHASYVCTDSFHCTAFSIQYERPLFAFRRFRRKTAASTNSRLDTLFHMAGMTGRLFTGEENPVEYMEREPDFCAARENLQKAREQGFAYLRAALEDTADTDL